jgi:hypothetical protein
MGFRLTYRLAQRLVIQTLPAPPDYVLSSLSYGQDERNIRSGSYSLVRESRPMGNLPG